MTGTRPNVSHQYRTYCIMTESQQASFKSTDTKEAVTSIEISVTLVVHHTIEWCFQFEAKWCVHTFRDEVHFELSARTFKVRRKHVDKQIVAVVKPGADNAAGYTTVLATSSGSESRTFGSADMWKTCAGGVVNVLFQCQQYWRSRVKSRLFTVDDGWMTALEIVTVTCQAVKNKVTSYFCG